MQDASFIPAEPGQITAEWLNAVLSPKLPGSQVVDVDVEDVGVGYGFVSRLARLHLKWSSSDPTLPATLFAKLPSDEWLRIADRDTGLASTVYLLEVAFYVTVAPHVGVRVPACYHSAATPTGNPFVLLLEDVRGEQLDQLAPCPRDRAETVIGALARLHAKWWNQAGPDRVFWLPGTDHEGYREVANRVYESFEPWLETTQTMVFDSWPQDLDPSLPQRIIELAQHLRDKAPAYFEGMAASGQQTLVHGDVRLDNIVFVDGDPCFLDWQLVKRYPGPYDVAYFLSGSLPIEDRRRWEESLVARYHDELLRQGVGDYTLEACWHDYRRSMLLTAFGAMVASEWPEPTERGLQLFRTVLARHWTFMLDHDVASFLRG